jgi:hypothetical protein
MATKTQADIAALVLEALGVKAASQSASAEDTAAASDAVSSAYYRLRYEQKAPFSLSSIPEWAWIPLRDFVARDLVNTFGISGDRLQSIHASASRADRDFAIQTAGLHDPRVTIVPRWF